jgi:hypothetical protein
VTTLAAATRIPITSASNGTAVELSQPKTDSLYTFVSSDNITYVTGSDTKSPYAGNMTLGKFSSDSTLAYASVNLLSGYGGFDTTDGTDGPGSTAMSNKNSGLFGMAGNLYMFVHRDYYLDATYPGQPIYFGNIIKSTDHGATWNNWLNKTTFNANGIEPPVTGGSKGQFQFAKGTYGWASPIRYAADDGTFGYLTAGNRIDGADGFVYITFLDGLPGLYNNGNVYLMRVPRVQLDAQSTTAFQYWIGTGTPTPSSFVNDANWSTSDTSKTSIYTSPNQVSWPEVDYIPGINYYLLFTFSMTGLPSFTGSTWTIMAGPTPAGPWTTVLTQNNMASNPCTTPGDACAYYGLSPMHRDLVGNVLKNNIPIRLLYAGSPFTPAQVAYALTYSTLTLSTSAVTGGAFLRGSYSPGAAIR